MTREELRSEIIAICSREFEMENPDPDDDLREKLLGLSSSEIRVRLSLEP